ncbi:MAG: hypothetical protein HQK67_05865 [Desulfamplus sp.]|nr:hypothetical protein [Desulfamplus sp.]
MIENNFDTIYDNIFSDMELHQVFYMREKNNSENFDAEKALETARKSNFREAMDEICFDDLL